MSHPRDKIQQLYKALCQGQRLFSLKSLVQPAHFENHVSDMACMGQHLQEKTLAELGAGVGLNIFLLAILCPTHHFIAIEKNNKRRGWMQIQRQHLKLENVRIASQLSDLSDQHDSPMGLLLKAFSPRDHLPSLLEQCPRSVVSIYVVEGSREGLSPMIPKGQFAEVQVIPMSHGRERHLKIFQRIPFRD